MPWRRKRKDDAGETLEDDACQAPEDGTGETLEDDAGETLKPGENGRRRWYSNETIAVGDPSPTIDYRPPGEEYRRHPYRPDTVADGWMVDELEWRGASVRGLAHRFDGVPRQDDFAVYYDAHRKFFYCVVADGVSGAKQSHIASTIVARFAITWLEQNTPDDPESTNWEQLAEHLSYALIDQASTLFGSEMTPLSAEKLVATTVVCSIIDFTKMYGEGEATAHIFSIGDSGVFVLNEGGFKNAIGGKDVDALISSSAVHGLPRIPSELQSTSVKIGMGDILLLGTDGFSDPLGDGTGELGNLFRTILLGEAPPILQFVHALDFSRSTFDDDRTLVAIWPRAQAPSCD